MNRTHPHTKNWLLAILLLAFVACTEQVQIELESTQPRLVVEGSVTTDSCRHQVLLTVTSDYFSNKPPSGLSNATVELSFNDKLILFEKNDSLPGLYESPLAFRGVPGTTYQLDIRDVFIEEGDQNASYRATSTMPGGSELEYIEIEYFPTSLLSGHVVFMYTSHPPDQRDWFGFKLLKNGDLLTDSLSKYFVMADDLFDDGYFPGLPVGFLNDADPRQAVHQGDTVTFELDCIDQFYYEYISSALLEIVGNNPLFSGPPSNVKSNVDNGAFGYFIAYSVQRTSIVMP